MNDAVEFRLDEARPLLERTPAALRALLAGLPEPWLRTTDGEGQWSAFDVVGHLVDGEETDWIPRARMILEHGTARTFEPFDRLAQVGRTMARRYSAGAGPWTAYLRVLRPL